MNEKYILQIGPKGQGGVNVVIESIIHSRLNISYNFKRVITQSGHDFVLVYIKALITCIRYHNKIAIAHVHMASKGSFIRKRIIVRLLVIMGIPVIIHLHGAKFREYYQDLNAVGQLLVRRCFASAKNIIVLTKDWTSFMEEIGCWDKAVVIPNFTSVPDLSSKKSFGGQCQVLFLGRIGERKGAYDLINAMAILRDSDRAANIKVVVAGDGEIEKIKRKIEEKQLENIISVVGWLDNEKKQELLSHGNMVVLPSYFESFGLSLIEGMSYGLPVIGTTAGSIPNVVDNGQDGYLIEAGDVHALAERIYELASDAKLRDKMGSTGREHVIRSYSEETFSASLDAVYSKILKGY